MQKLSLTDFNWHRDQPDVSQMSAGEMKAFLDAPSETLMGKVNEIIGENGAPSLSELDGRQGDLEQKMVSFITESDAPDVPQAVIEGASALVDKALSHESKRVLRFVVYSDVHQKNDHELITKGTRELGMAQKEVLKMMGVDFVACLGDVAWGSNSETAPVVIDQIKTYKRLCGEALLGQTQIVCKGNHDDASYALSNFPEGPLVSSYALNALLLGANDTRAVYDEAHRDEGYFYVDFERQKVRLIMLNTEQTGDTIAAHQTAWFANVALDMSGKEGWSVLTMAHRPLDFATNHSVPGVLSAFIKRQFYMSGSSSGESLFADFTATKSDYIGHIHGHTHAFSVVKMRLYNGGGEIDAYEMGIPNACYGRNNQNRDLANEHIARFSTPETYNKEDKDGLRTSFNLVTIDLDSKVVYLDNYGAGIDRAVNYDFYKYTNQLPIATDVDGSVYNGKGFKEDTYMSGDSMAVGSKAGIVLTGFIPIPETTSYDKGQVLLRFANAQIPNASYTRITLYDADKNPIGLASATTFVTADTSGLVDKIAVWDENGHLVSLDHSETCNYYKVTAAEGNRVAKYLRICAAGIDENTIITVNEEIR